MEETLTLGGVKYTVRKWPFRPGWRFSQRITQQIACVLDVLLKGDLGGGLVDLGKIDFGKIAAVLSEENFDLAVEMIANGLEFKACSLAEQKNTVEDFDFEDGMLALETVLRKNLTFLLARFDVLRKSSATSTPPPQSSAEPASRS